jgi:hypothetical protein
MTHPSYFPALDSGPTLSTAKAARWLGVSERAVRDMCIKGKFKGAYRPAGYNGKWLIPMTTLEAICPMPADRLLIADIAKVAETAEI